MQKKSLDEIVKNLDRMWEYYKQNREELLAPYLEDNE